MKEQSELLEKCGFFNNFRGNSEVIKKGWIRLYCEDKEKSETCERKKSVKKQGNHLKIIWHQRGRYCQILMQNNF